MYKFEIFAISAIFVLLMLIASICFISNIHAEHMAKLGYQEEQMLGTSNTMWRKIK